jgi:hypothetical protein
LGGCDSECVLQEVKPEVVKEVEAPKETYKQDDFFDSLSCEALERAGISEGSRPEKPQVRAPAKYKGCYMRDIMFGHAW